MGIPGLLKHLRETYPGTWISNQPNPIKYDFLFLDFQSIIYSLFGVIGNEINYFIRLGQIYKSLESDRQKMDFLLQHEIKFTWIIKNYVDYFSLYGIQSADFVWEFKNEISLGKRNKTVSQKLSQLMDKLNDQINYNLNWNQFLGQRIVNLVKSLSDYLVNKKDCYSNTFIFFDGIPTKAKIKEQISRRIFPEVLGAIKSSIDADAAISGDLTLEMRIKEKLVKLPHIGPGTDFLIQLRRDFEAVSDPVKGKFYVNGEKILGEAEHQIMSFIHTNTDKFANKKILLSSPDADLILLSFISISKNFMINLLRVDKINEENFNFKIEDLDVYKLNRTPFQLVFEYINTWELLKKIGIAYDMQKTIDLSFILLLLGDDFLPKIPTLKIDNLTDIIEAYNSAKVKIIDFDKSQNQYKIIHCNLLEFFKELIKNDNEYNWDQKTMTFHNNKVKNMKNLAFSGIELNGQIKMLPKLPVNKQIIPQPQKRYPAKKLVPLPGSEYQHMFYDQKTYFKWLLENKGFYNKARIIPQNVLEFSYTRNGLEQDFHKDFYSNFTSLFKKRSALFNGSKKPVELVNLKPSNKTKYDNKMKNYLEGYTFILDAYLNNNIRNYEWVYKYSSAPTITQLVAFMDSKSNGDLSIIFNYVKSSGPNITDIYSKLKYMDITSYRLYMENSKLELLKEIAIKVINKLYPEPGFNSTKKAELKAMTKEQILTEYFTYQNADLIFDCSDSFYLNKCLEGHVIDNIKPYEKQLQIKDNNLEFMDKYLKYKIKYFQLKKLLNEQK
jgi:hypothetical protein